MSTYECPCCGHQWSDEEIVQTAASAWALFRDAWNNWATEMQAKGVPIAKVAKKNETLKSSLNARMKEDSLFFQQLDDALAFMSGNTFYHGINDRNWVPGAGYILQASKVQTLANKQAAIRQAAIHRENKDATTSGPANRFADRRRHDSGAES